MKKLSEFYSIIKNSTNYNSIQEIVWVAIGQGLNVILSLIIVKIISQMGPNDYGVYTLIITISAFLGLIFGAFQQGFIRFYYDYKKDEKDGIYVNLFFKFLSLSVFILSLLIFLSSLIANTFIESYSLFFLITAGVMIVATKVSELFNSWFNILRHRKTNTILLSSEKTLIIICFVVLMINNSLSLLNVILFISLSTLVMIFIKIIMFKKYVNKPELTAKPEINILQKIMGKRIWVYATPFLIWAIAGWLQLNGEKWIINGILSVKEVGVYAIMMAIVNALVIIPTNVINEFATPIIFKNYSDLKNMDDINKGYLYINIIMISVFLLTVFSTTITYFFAEQLITIISTKEYSGYWYLLPLLTFGTGLFYLGQTQTILGLALDKPREYLFPKILVGVLAVLFNLFFIKIFGLNGVAYTIILIGFLYVIHISLINRKIESEFYKSIK